MDTLSGINRSAGRSTARSPVGNDRALFVRAFLVVVPGTTVFVTYNNERLEFGHNKRVQDDSIGLRTSPGGHGVDAGDDSDDWYVDGGAVAAA